MLTCFSAVIRERIVKRDALSSGFTVGISFPTAATVLFTLTLCHLDWKIKQARLFYTEDFQVCVALQQKGVTIFLMNQQCAASNIQAPYIP